MSHRAKTKGRPGGFTLQELVAVLVILVVVLAVLAPVLAQARQEARTNQGLSVLRGIGVATAAYTASNGDLLPKPWTQMGAFASAGLPPMTRRFITDAAATYNPADPEHGGMSRLYADELIDGGYADTSSFADPMAGQWFLRAVNPTENEAVPVSQQWPTAPVISYLATSFPELSSMQEKYGSRSLRHIPQSLVVSPSESMWVMDGYVANSPPQAVPWGYLHQYRTQDGAGLTEGPMVGPKAGFVNSLFFDGHAELRQRDWCLMRVGDPGIATLKDRFWPDPAVARIKPKFWDFVHANPLGQAQNDRSHTVRIDSAHRVDDRVW